MSLQAYHPESFLTGYGKGLWLVDFSVSQILIWSWAHYFSWLTKSLQSSLFFSLLLAGHIPVHPYSVASVCIAWNFDEILTLLQSHKSVVCFMAGHDHDGGYYLDLAGIHHLTVEGVIETPPGSDAFGTVFVYEDKMILRGNGRITDRVLMYRWARGYTYNIIICILYSAI